MSNGVLEAAAPAPGPFGDGFGYTFVLVGNRTIRPNILKGFKKYHGGWDITNRHYWAILVDGEEKKKANLLSSEDFEPALIPSKTNH